MKILSNLLINDFKEVIPKKSNILFRKEDNYYTFFDKNQFRGGYMDEWGFKIINEINNKLTFKEIFENLLKKTHLPNFVLAELLIRYMKELNEMHLIEFPKEINRINIKRKPKLRIPLAPYQIATLLTNECNLRCSHCGNENRDKKSNELTKEEWFKFIDECSELKVFIFNVSGGEAFLRKEWYEILSYARKKGLEVGITSNGTLIDENIAKKLKELDIYNIHLSLEGIKEIHDNFRNKQGVFAKVENSIKLLKKYKVPFGITTAVSKRNLNDLDEVKNYIKNSGIQSWEIYSAIPIGCMDKKEALDEKETLLFAKKISQYKQELKETRIFVGDNLGYFDSNNTQEEWEGCKAGITICAIDSEGNIKGCPIHPNSFIEGNIRNKSFKSIWQDKNAFSYNRHPISLEKHCKKCKHSKICRGGCKASMLAQGTELKYNNLCLYHIENELHKK